MEDLLHYQTDDLASEGKKVIMAIKKGDILDERKRFPDSCGLVIKIAGGGEGFQQVRCCGHILTEEDVVPDVLPSRGRKKGAFMPGAMLEEKRQFPNSCGLRLIVLDGAPDSRGLTVAAIPSRLRLSTISDSAGGATKPLFPRGRQVMRDATGSSV